MPEFWQRHNSGIYGETQAELGAPPLLCYNRISLLLAAGHDTRPAHWHRFLTGEAFTTPTPDNNNLRLMPDWRTLSGTHAIGSPGEGAASSGTRGGPSAVDLPGTPPALERTFSDRAMHPWHCYGVREA